MTSKEAQDGQGGQESTDIGCICSNSVLHVVHLYSYKGITGLYHIKPIISRGCKKLLTSFPEGVILKYENIHDH